MGSIDIYNALHKKQTTFSPRRRCSAPMPAPGKRPGLAKSNINPTGAQQENLPSQSLTIWWFQPI